MLKSIGKQSWESVVSREKGKEGYGRKEGYILCRLRLMFILGRS